MEVGTPSGYRTHTQNGPGCHFEGPLRTCGVGVNVSHSHCRGGEVNAEHIAFPSGRTCRQLALEKGFGYGSIARQIGLSREHQAMSPYMIQTCVYYLYIRSRRSATVNLDACARAALFFYTHCASVHENDKTFDLKQKAKKCPSCDATRECMLETTFPVGERTPCLSQPSHGMQASGVHAVR